MSSHPGCTMEEAVRLAEYLRDTNHEPEQVQDFYPTPSTLSTVMYYTGLDPRTMEPVYVPKNPHEKAMQRALMQYRRPQNYFLVREALQKGRPDRSDRLYTEMPHPPYPPKRAGGRPENHARKTGQKTPARRWSSARIPSYSLPYEEKMRWNYGKHSQSHYPDRDAGVPAGNIRIRTTSADFFRFLLAVERLSGTEDLLPVLAAEDVLEQAELFEGERFTIEGQIRSFNNREPTGRRLILCVYALSMMTTDAPMQNEAVPDRHGLQSHPFTGRHRSAGRSPICVWPCRACTAGRIISLCILWGRTALAAAEYPTGTELTLTGRLRAGRISKTWARRARRAPPRMNSPSAPVSASRNLRFF